MTATPWRQAYRIAADLTPAPPIRVGLHGAVGTMLAQPVSAVTDLPVTECAQAAGWAVRGVGPWQTTEASQGELRDGAAVQVWPGDSLPPGTLAVLPHEWAVLVETATGPLVMVGDAQSGARARRPGMITPGSGISEAGSDARAGDLLLKAGTVVTAGTIALAAAAGADSLIVVPPATVAPVLLGSDLLDSGPPRRGKDRDVIAPLLPSWVMGTGGRCLPEQAGPRDGAALAGLIDGIGAELTVLTATAEPGIGTSVIAALRLLQAEILVDHVAARPAGAVLLAELRDGRRILALPREPDAAVVVMALLLSPMLQALSGRTVARPDSVMLRDGISTERADRAVAVQIDKGELADLASVQPWSGPHGLGALATADAIAFVDAGRGDRGDSVPVVPLPGTDS